jgi:plasmid replication initiation protein
VTEVPASAVPEGGARSLRQRLLRCVLTKINGHSGAPLPITAETRIEIHVALLSTLSLLSKKQACELLRSAVDKLKERWLVIDAPDPDTGLKQTRCRWVHTIDYYDDKGKLGLYLSPKVIPVLLQLASEFTCYRICSVAKMTSVYAIRIYELLLQWRENGRREMSLDWLKARLELHQGEYGRIDLFKKRIIEPAVEQINAHSNLQVRCTPIKRGRTVVGFLFEFARVAKTSGEARAGGNPRGPLSSDVIAALTHPGETWDQARKRLESASALPNVL